jgi:hypothetical protein
MRTSPVYWRTSLFRFLQQYHAGKYKEAAMALVGSKQAMDYWKRVDAVEKDLKKMGIKFELKGRKQIDEEIKKILESGEEVPVTKAPKKIGGQQIITLDRKVKPELVEMALGHIDDTIKKEEADTDQKLKDIWTTLSVFKLPKEKVKEEKLIRGQRPSIINIINMTPQEIAKQIADNPGGAIAGYFRKVVKAIGSKRLPKPEKYQAILEELVREERLTSETRPIVMEMMTMTPQEIANRIAENTGGILAGYFKNVMDAFEEEIIPKYIDEEKIGRPIEIHKPIRYVDILNELEKIAAKKSEKVGVGLSLGGSAAGAASLMTAKKYAPEIMEKHQ